MSMCDMEEELAKCLAVEIAREMDFSIIADMLVEDGWTKVTTDRINLEEVEKWTKRNFKGNYQSLGGTYVFKFKADAEWFTLQWT